MTASTTSSVQANFPELIACLAAQPGIVAAILFGSAAAGRLRPESDLDLALLFDYEQVPDEFAVLEMRAALEQCARRDVDLIVLNQASPILAFQSVKKGQILLGGNSAAYQRYLIRLISEYADFKRIRRPIEEAVLRRRIYDGS